MVLSISWHSDLILAISAYPQSNAYHCNLSVTPENLCQAGNLSTDSGFGLKITLATKDNSSLLDIPSMSSSDSDTGDAAHLKTSLDAALTDE